MKPKEFFDSQIKKGIQDSEVILENYCITSLVTLAETIEANNLSEEDTHLLLIDIEEKCITLEHLVAEHFHCEVAQNSFKKYATAHGILY